MTGNYKEAEWGGGLRTLVQDPDCQVRRVALPLISSVPLNKLLMSVSVRDLPEKQNY